MPPPARTSAAPTPSRQLSLQLFSVRWPPFADEDGRARIALDLTERALTRAGYKATTELVPDGSLNSALRDERFAGSSVLWQSPEREEYLLYSNPYFENRLVLVGAPGSRVDLTSLDELKGKRLGIVTGYAYGAELEQSREVTFVPAPSTEDNLRALLHGEVDYVLVDDLVIHHVLEEYPGKLKGRIEIGRTPLIKRTLHLALHKSHPDAQKIIDAFNAALVSMLRDGSYNELLQVAWIRADIDNDGRPELISAGDQVGSEPPQQAYDLMASAQAAGAPPLRDVPPEPRFVIKGVPYDSWSAVPSEHKTRTDPTRTDDLGAKPRTLRVEVFDF
jgi:polar amino acid transport system substrate-binding protein